MTGEIHPGGEALRPEPELALELSPESLIAIQENFGMSGGKFLRIGPDIILIAPVAYKIRDAEVKVFHRQILPRMAESRNEELKNRVRLAQAAASGHSVLDSGSAVTDAGFFFFSLNEAGEVSSFDIEGDSTHYGGTTAEKRAQTAAVARRQLGDQVEVRTR